MKKLFYLLLLVPIIALGVSSTGVGVDKTTASLAVPMDIKEKVKIRIGINTVTWDFNEININPNNPPFPPTSFPEYYEPSDPSDRYYQTIEYQVTGQAENWEVTIAGAGDPAPACGILLSDIEYGDGAAGVWTPLSSEPQVLSSGSGNTHGWVVIFQDYRVKIDGNETNTIGSSTTIIYTIQTF